MSTFRYRFVGVSADEIDRYVENGSGSTRALLARPPWSSVTLTDDTRESDLNEFMAQFGYVPDATGPTVVVSADHIVGSESVILVDASAGPVEITLPPTDERYGDELLIIKTDSSSNLVTVVGDGVETIQGDASQVFSGQWEALRVSSDGTSSDWSILSSRRAQDIVFDPTGTGLIATDLQAAVQELAGASSPLAVEDEGVLVDANVATLNFTGRFVTATQTVAGEVEVNVDPNPQGASFGYNVSEELTTVTYDDMSVKTLTYNASGQLITVVYEGVTKTLSYNPDGSLDSVTIS